MTLKRTTIIPDNPVEAKAIYDQQVAHEKRTIMAIIGNTETVQEAVIEANALAHEQEFDNVDRWVLWAKDHGIVKDTLELILAESNAERSDRDFDQIKCFCISPVRREVEGIILKNGELNSISLDKSFLKAERHDNALLNS